MALVRSEQLEALRRRPTPWDLIVIGGGATGAGIALDAASRGYAVALIERHDFGKGTSSRSTKLIHGGVRYLATGDLSLVREALRERSYLLRNAPHLVHELPFVVPCRRWWERTYYGLGLGLYQRLAGRDSLRTTRRLGRDELLSAVPTLRPDFWWGVVYADGQFDDARLLIDLLKTAVEQGAVVVNYCPARGLIQDAAGRVVGVEACDAESGARFQLRARLVINATGVFCDTVRRMAEARLPPLVAPSQGVHLVLPGRFLPGHHALMIPRTDDGRVLFAIPWHGHVLLGTTDVARSDAPLEPRASDAEIDFILDTAGHYLTPAPTRADVLSVFVGIRPLVRAARTRSTARLSRDHTIQVEVPGLLTITGGKWTTYRNMAEDAVNQAARLAGLPERPCLTAHLPIHGGGAASARTDHRWVYGSDAAAVAQLAAARPEWATPLHADLPYTAAEVVWAARQEMARTVEDVLARRTRALMLNARAAMTAAPKVAALLARECGRDAAWEAAQVADFTALAQGYLPLPDGPRAGNLMPAADGGS